MNINNYTALALIVDRSGSMQPIASDVRGSIKQLIGDQKNQEGKASLTVCQFDDQYEIVHNFEDINNVDENRFAKEYCPRGATALLDAIGKTTLLLQNKIESLNEEDRPQRVVVAVITDGEENASREFKIEQIKEMIKAQEANGWSFLFMGATFDTIKVAEQMGFAKDRSAYYETSKFANCMSSIYTQMTNARQNQEVKISDQEREDLKTPL